MNCTLFQVSIPRIYLRKAVYKNVLKSGQLSQLELSYVVFTLAKNWMKPTIVFYKSFKTSPGFGKLLSLCWLIDTSHFYGTQFEKFVLTMGPAPLPLKLPTFFMGNFSLVCFIGQRAAQIISILWDSNKNLGIR